MKKNLRKVLLGVALISCAGAVTLAANYAMDKPTNPTPVVLSESAAPLQERMACVGETTDPIYSYLIAHFDGDELYNLVADYALFKITNRPTVAELDTLSEILDLGMTLEQTIDIYRLWTSTASPREIMVQIAQYYTSEMEQIPFWTHDAYNSITGNKALNSEEIQAYLDSGLTREDILTADEFSRRQVYNIDQLLRLKQQGDSWVEIASLVYSALNQPLSLRSVSAYDGLSGTTVLDCLSLAQTFEMDLEVLFEKAVAEEDYREEIRQLTSVQLQNELKKLRDDGIWDLTTEERAQRAETMAYVLEKAQERQISAELVTQLSEEGYDPISVLNAVTQSQIQHISPQQILSGEVAAQ